MRVFGGKSKQMFCNYTANVKPQGQNQIEGTYIECRDTNSLSKKGTTNTFCFQVGCDLVEVSPIYDVSGTTAIAGANLLYEMLCVLPGVNYVLPDV